MPSASKYVKRIAGTAAKPLPSVFASSVGVIPSSRACSGVSPDEARAAVKRASVAGVQSYFSLAADRFELDDAPGLCPFAGITRLPVRCLLFEQCQGLAQQVAHD